jgi:hypothetical protein
MDDTTTTTTTDAAVKQGAWYDALEPEERQHVTSKGFDKFVGDDIPKMLYQSYRNVEKMIGIPQEQLAYIPKDASDPKWGELYERLGAPKEAAGYDFAGAKFKDGAPAPEDFVAAVRDIAVKNHLTVAQAQAVAAGYMTFSEAIDEQAEREASTRLGAEQLAVKTNWGANYQMNEFIAGKGAETLGLDKDMVTAIQAQLGYQKTMDMLLATGQKLNEAGMYKGNGGADGVKGLTQAQAVTRKAELMIDQNWVKRFLSSDRDALREMSDLNTIIVGTAPVA